MRPAARLQGAAPVQSALQWQASGPLSSPSGRSVLNLRRICFQSSSYAAVVMRRPEPVIRSSRSGKGTRSGLPLRRLCQGRGFLACLAALGFHLLQSVRGVGAPPWVGGPGETHRASRWAGMPRLGQGLTGLNAGVLKRRRLGDVPCGRHRESNAQSLWQVQRGRPFGEQGSILCGWFRVQGRDPPGFWGGKRWKKPDHAFQYLAPPPPTQGFPCPGAESVAFC